METQRTSPGGSTQKGIEIKIPGALFSLPRCLFFHLLKHYFFSDLHYVGVDDKMFDPQNYFTASGVIEVNLATMTRLGNCKLPEISCGTTILTTQLTRRLQIQHFDEMKHSILELYQAVYMPIYHC